MTKSDLSQTQLHTNEKMLGRKACHSAAAVAGVDDGTFYHDPVMLGECLDGLNIKADGVYVDCTLGGGGHSYAISNKLNSSGKLHAFDRDDDAVTFATKRLSKALCEFIVHPVPFGELGNEIESDSVDGILYDLGISSHQVDDSTRGFTFVGNNPLDLRMDRRGSIGAQEWLRSVSADDLAAALRKNADMERAFKLSTCIKEIVADIDAEENGRDVLPSDVKIAVEKVFPDKRRDTNGLLARVFQAIRMEVNGELTQIEDSIRAAVTCLKIGGRLVIMSYHSVEDRCVKETCAEFEKACVCPENLPVCVCGGNHQKLKKVNRKPILPTAEEIDRNSRARSAKLRVYERV